MKDPFYPIGSVVTTNIGDQEEQCMVIGHRIINHLSMRAWDYVAVEYPQGLERHFKNDKTFDCDQFYYFNHRDIIKIVHEADLINVETEE